MIASASFGFAARSFSACARSASSLARLGSVDRDRAACRRARWLRASVRCALEQRVTCRAAAIATADDSCDGDHRRMPQSFLRGSGTTDGSRPSRRRRASSGRPEQVGAVQDPRRRVDRLQRLDLAAGRGAEFLELAGRDQHARFVRADDFVERLAPCCPAACAACRDNRSSSRRAHTAPCPSDWISSALCASRSCRQPCATTCSSAIKRDRARGKDLRAHAVIDRASASCWSADWKNDSPGRNITTNSGDGCTCSQ